MFLLEGITFTPITSGMPIPEQHCDMSEEAKEDRRRHHQARLAHLLKRNTAGRLLGEDQSTTARTEHPVEARRKQAHAYVLMQKSLYPKHEKPWGFQLDNVILIIDKKVESSLGTLEARGSGFIFTAPGFHVHFKDTSIYLSLLRHGDDMMPPLLQFHLHRPMMVGEKEMNSIQFHLVNTAVDCNKQASYLDRNKDLDKFVRGVAGARWDSSLHFSPFQDLNDCQFEGVLSQGPGSAALTSRALVLLDERPFSAVTLKDIEIVNLAQFERHFDMSVVYKDFSREVLQIRGIDLTLLASIKDLLYNVKYYCNSRILDWNSVLTEILERPKKFVESGGWESLHLEDQLTLSYYDTEKPRDYCNEIYQ